MTRNKKRKSQSYRQSSPSPAADVLELHDENSNIWLTNQIEEEAMRKTTRSNQKYDETDVCIIGLERIISVMNDDGADDHTVSKIDSQLQLAKMYHIKFYESMCTKKSGISATQMHAHTAKMDRVDRLYNDLLNKLTNIKKKLLIDDTIVNSTVHAHEPQVHDVKIKAVDIERFAGSEKDRRKWPQFKSMFEEIFHNRSTYTGSTKFYHLMSHLVPDSEPYNTISGFDRTDANYESAWKTLCEAYDNERKIVNDIVLSFLDMPALDEPSRAGLIALKNNTNNLINSLPKYKIEVQHWDPILVPLLIRKMDGESIRLWSLERDQKKIAELQPLLDFIQKRADGMEADCVVKLNNTTVVNRQQSATFANNKPDTGKAAVSWS